MQSEYKAIYDELFITHKAEMDNIISKYKKAINQKEEFELGFNVFALVSDTYHKENLHSAVLAEILNPKGSHQEGDLYLRLFIEYLNTSFSLNIEYNNYLNATVVNESYGRIDLIIKSDSHAIIIENKINNAGDMKNQILRYYLNCINMNLQVDAIIYLTKEGIREPNYKSWNNNDELKDNKLPLSNDKYNELKDKIIPNLVKRVACFDISKKEDLTNGWLDACIGQSNKIENIFILKQYKQLFKHLRQFIMETNSLKKLYELIGQNPNSSQVIMFAEAYGKLNEIFPDILTERLTNTNAKVEKFLNYCVLIKGIFNDNLDYYLKVEFLNTTTVNIFLMNNEKNWTLNDKLIKDSRFTNLNFIEEDEDYWYIRMENMNLFEEQGLQKILKVINTVLALGY